MFLFLIEAAGDSRGQVYDLGNHLRHTRTLGTTGTTKCQIDYRPTQRQQDEYVNRYNTPGINGDFIIRYDVAHPPGVGEVQVKCSKYADSPSFAPATIAPGYTLSNMYG